MTEDKIIEELSTIIKNIGHFPSFRWLVRNKKSTLAKAIIKCPGKTERFKKTFGYKGRNYWSDWDTLVNAIKSIALNNTFPTQEIIRNNLGSGAVNSIRLFGGARKVASKIGMTLNLSTATDGHYVRSAKEFLLDEYLYSRGIEHSVDGFIDKNHGKYRFDFMVYSPTDAHKIFIEIWGYEGNPMSEILLKYNEKKSKKIALYTQLNLSLVSFDASVFKQKTTQLECMLDKTFEKLGFDISPKLKKFKISNGFKNSKFWNDEKIIDGIKEIILENKYFPTLKEIEIMRGDLHAAIVRKGGILKFKKILGYDVFSKSRGFWNEKTIIEELKIIVSRTGHYPNRQELIKMKRKDLYFAIRYYGGFIHFHKIICPNESINQKPGYWNDEKIIQELKSIINYAGKFPKYNELRQCNGKLCSTIDKYGGLNKFKKIIEIG